MNSKTVFTFARFFLLPALLIFFGCSVTSDSDDPDAQIPAITSISGDVTTVLHVAQKLSVGVEISDKGKLSYQWYVADTKLENGTAIDSADEESFSPETERLGTFYYYCVITNRLGNSTRSVTSPRITYTVNDSVNAAKPVIVQQPENVTSDFGKDFLLSVNAYSPDGGRISYQWYFSPGEGDATAVEGANTSTYKGAVGADTIGSYYCVVTNTIEDNGDGGKKSVGIQTETAWLSAVYLKDVVPAPVFTKQPPMMNVAAYNQGVTLSCEAEVTDYTVRYKWYESSDGTSALGKAAAGGSGMDTNTFTTPVFTQKGIRYFYCVATTVIASGEGDDVNTIATISDVVSVACTGLPVVKVETPDRVEITSNTEWTENATISLTGASDDSWNFETVTTSIRGRGNSTWGQPKKPYALKLDKKQKIMGFPKHKRWVLIANYLDNSFLRNEMAFYLSEQVGLDWTVHGEFVDLVLNGEYKGLYWLGEAIKVDENRVNINDGTETMSDDEDKDYLIEMDVYYDEIVKFKSSIRNMPYMIKNDDYMIDDNNVITSGGEARLSRLQEKITALEEKLYPDFTAEMNTNNCAAPDESYSEVIDIDSWAKFWFVNEIMNNGELGHPKSCYFTFDSTNNILKAGPVWDFDWASLSQASSCRLKATIYYDALFKSPAFVSRTKELWSKSYANIDISTQIEAMREQISLAAVYDTMLWGAHKDPSGIVRADFDAYVDFLKDTLEKKLVVVNTAINEL